MATQRLLVALQVSALCAAAAATDPIRVDGGLVSGTTGKDASVHVYKGIPYAAPPVGELRWKAPKAVIGWQGVRTADQFAASCVQKIAEERKPWTTEFMTHTPISEDCLHLNIWTAAASANEKRPVLVWIYGGGLVEGSGAVDVYNGEALAKKGLVVVNMNYRLNVFGFFNHPELTKESDRGSSGNYGYLDQVAALEWVNRNIAAFGGDPARVTIAGQSAGAGSVLALMASPLAKGLFVGAIADSGSRIGRPSRPLAEAERDGVKFAAALGKSDLKQLRSVPANDLSTAFEAGSLRWGAVVDGWFLPGTIDAVFAAGKQNDVPFITGSNADEGSSAANYGKIPAAEFTKKAHERFGAMTDAYLKLYPADTDAHASLSQVESPRDEYLVSTYLWAVNRAKTAKTPIHTYYWTHALPGPDKNMFQAFHTSEVPYFFNSLDHSPRSFDKTDHAIAERLSSYWVNFVTTGNPNGKGLPAWPEFKAEEKMVTELGEHIGPRPIAAAAKAAFFEEYIRHGGK